ncbi:hypothetical protein [Streptomyces sp. AC550_RSS872]|uniref:hypothetical protein n=1 Tax=Streptomyces sp. AC550_RSS872 TaxID=2823689 RepID=UPI001C2698F4|nr:hypothetical protein [Streptomyces sp. AC550_RSS872]
MKPFSAGMHPAGRSMRAHELDGAPAHSLVGASKSSAGRTVDHLGLLLARQPCQRLRQGAVIIMDDTLVPTRDRSLAE